MEDFIKRSEYDSRVFIDQHLCRLYQTEFSGFLATPQVGDHLVSWRAGYTHHGLYVGENASGVPSVVHYSGFAKNFKAGPVNEVSLESFSNGAGYSVQPHRNPTHSREESVRRAYERLKEKEYSLAFNNCEHFVNHCIEGVHVSRQVSGVLRVSAKTASRSVPIVNWGAIIYEAGISIKAYIKGEIDGKKLASELSHVGLTSASMAWYASLGQAAIPVPVVGAMAGAGLGYFIGNALHQSGHIALGETAAVAVAKERREEIEKICEDLIVSNRAHRQKLEQYLDRFFSGRSEVFKAAFTNIDSAISGREPDQFAAALSAINHEFNNALNYQSFDEFDSVMNSEEALKF